MKFRFKLLGMASLAGIPLVFICFGFEKKLRNSRDRDFIATDVKKSLKGGLPERQKKIDEKVGSIKKVESPSVIPEKYSDIPKLREKKEGINEDILEYDKLVEESKKKLDSLKSESDQILEDIKVLNKRHRVAILEENEDLILHLDTEISKKRDQFEKAMVKENSALQIYLENAQEHLKALLSEN